MSSSTPDAAGSAQGTRAAVLTVSDSCSRGEKADLSGPAVAEALARHKFQVTARGVVADERAAIQEKLIELCASARLVVTTGGTGLPRATLRRKLRLQCASVWWTESPSRCDCREPETRYAALSRAVCGIRGTSLILNLPGSPAGAVEVTRGGDGFVATCVGLIAGKTEHGS